MNCLKFKKNKLWFYFGYIIFFISLYIGDLAIYNDISLIVKTMKALTIIILVVGVLQQKLTQRTFQGLIILGLVGMIILLFSGDFFFFLVILLSYNSVNINDEDIYKLTYSMCILVTMVTLILFLLGVLPDIITYRTDFSDEIRHSFGFYHSNVLPVMLNYIACYYVLIKKEATKIPVIFIFGIVGILSYEFCKSRMAFISMIIIVMIVLFLKNKITRKILCNLIKFFDRAIVQLAILFSVIPGYLRFKGILMSAWDIYDKIFTNRSLLAASAIEGYGIKLVNVMKYSEYIGMEIIIGEHIWKGIVLDSAYMYLLIRYGILILVFVYVVLVSYYKKEKENIYECAIFCVMVLMNTIDNDILSYSCMPLLIIGIRSIRIKNLKWR